MLNGILVVDKPTDWTSFDVVAKLRGVLNTRKIGHSGTLDPMATGVLPLFVGLSARAVDMQKNNTKRYTAAVKFGQSTDTGDITGTTLCKSDKLITAAELCEALPHFLGRQQQIPPMYSAVKVNGQPLYKLARKGIEIDRKPREIQIFEINFLGGGNNEYVLDVLCSKGTYIRTLLQDIGERLQCPAVMTALRRTQNGDYNIKNAYTLEEIYAAKEKGELQKLLLSVDTVFADLPKITATPAQEKRLHNGAGFTLCAPDGEYRVYREQNEEFLGVAAVQNGECRVKKLFTENPYA